MVKHTLIKKKGIDDLKSEYFFHGCWGQGDNSYTNDLKLAKSQPDYWKPVVKINFPLTQYNINRWVERRKMSNENYVRQCKQDGTYGDDIEIHLEVQHNPLYDTPPSPTPLESSKMTILNFR